MECGVLGPCPQGMAVVPGRQAAVTVRAKHTGSSGDPGSSLSVQRLGFEDRRTLLCPLPCWPSRDVAPRLTVAPVCRTLTLSCFQGRLTPGVRSPSRAQRLPPAWDRGSDQGQEVGSSIKSRHGAGSPRNNGGNHPRVRILTTRSEVGRMTPGHTVSVPQVPNK